MGGNRIGHRIHAGKERPACRCQRFVGLKYDGELDQVVAAYPYQRPRPRFCGNLAAVCEGVAKLAQRDQSITGGQIECLFRIPETSDHEELFPHCFTARGVCYPAQAGRASSLCVLQISARAVTAEPWDEATAHLMHRVQDISK